MLKEVLFMGVREAARLEPSQTMVIISILDQFEEHNRPRRLHEFKDHLILNFVDTFEKPGERHWRDQMSEAEHRVACTWDEDRAPELMDAQRIVEFFNRHHRAAEAMTLVVHCHGGVSRSAAVAQWVGETYGISMPQLTVGECALPSLLGDRESVKCQTSLPSMQPKVRSRAQRAGFWSHTPKACCSCIERGNPCRTSSTGSPNHPET